MPDLADWSQSVSIDAASVTIPVSGSVSITSGSVTIANASIAVINASGTKITSSRPPALFGQGSFVTNPNPNTYNIAVPADIQALVVELPNALTKYVHVKIKFHYGISDSAYVPLELFAFTQQIYVIPLMFTTFGQNQGQQTTIDLTIQATDLLGVVNVYALFEPNPLWLQLFPQPQLAPNQFPKTAILTLAALVAQWVIQSVANVQITLFNIVVMRYNPSVANDDFVLGYNASLPTNGNPVPNAQVLVDSTQTAASGTGPMFTIPLAGVQLPRGAGLFADTSLSGVANLWLLVEYSLS